MNIRWSIFPKFFTHLQAHELAFLVREVGLDTTNAVIRAGAWVTPANMRQELPRFVRITRDTGLQVHFATAGFSPEKLVEDETPLALLAENGIREFRMSYFDDRGGDVRVALQRARAQLEQLVPLCEKHGVRCVYQVHHGTLVSSASAAFSLVNGLPSQWMGIELDPGNQSFEGFENWNVAARLLREYLVAMGIKDSCLIRDPAKATESNKGWRRDWCPLDEGVTNWYDVVRALRGVNFNGTFVFMPFYDSDKPDVMKAKLRREVQYLRGVVQNVLKEHNEEL